MGQTRTLRNKMRPTYRTYIDEDGVAHSIKERPGSRGKNVLDTFNEKREDLSERGQMVQRHATKGDRGISVKRARAAQIVAAIQAGQRGAGNMHAMQNYMTNLGEGSY